MDSEKFEQELAKNLEPLDSDKDLGFHTGLQTGSFPSARKPLGIASHTSPTSWMCTGREWPSPHDCTSSVWDELVFIPVIEAPTVRKVELKKIWSPSNSQLFFHLIPCSLNYPIYPPTPLNLQWQNLYLFLAKLFKLIYIL